MWTVDSGIGEENYRCYRDLYYHNSLSTESMILFLHQD